MRYHLNELCEYSIVGISQLILQEFIKSFSLIRYHSALYFEAFVYTHTRMCMCSVYHIETTKGTRCVRNNRQILLTEV